MTAIERGAAGRRVLRRTAAALGAWGALLLAGCMAMAPVNPPIERVSPEAGYHIVPLQTLLKHIEDIERTRPR